MYNSGQETRWQSRRTCAQLLPPGPKITPTKQPSVKCCISHCAKEILSVCVEGVARSSLHLSPPQVGPGTSELGSARLCGRQPGQTPQAPDTLEAGRSKKHLRVVVVVFPKTLANNSFRNLRRLDYRKNNLLYVHYLMIMFQICSFSIASHLLCTLTFLSIIINICL